MKKRMFFFVFGLCLLGGSLTGSSKASAVSGNDYTAGNIISDAAMRNYNSMDVNAIQNFLKSKNACNDTRTYIASWYPSVYYHTENGHFVCMADETFNGKSAAQIIYQAAQDYHINPQVLIALLQKEQGLVTDTFPHNLQYRSATGYGCPDYSACEAKYYGFENQVRNAAALFDSVMNGGWTNYPVGWRWIYYYPNGSCGGSNVYIENKATSALYRYTPYQPNAAAKNAGYGVGDGCSTYGNRNFFLYFHDWFGNGEQSATVSASASAQAGTYYLPDGTYQILTTTGRSLDVYGANTVAGTNVQIWPNNGGNNQKFKITRETDGYYRITDVNSGKALDVAGASTVAGANVLIWDQHGGCNQKWALRYHEDSERYSFLSACSGKALDVTGGHVSTAGANIEIWDYHGRNEQQFKLVNLDEAPVKNGNYTLDTAYGTSVDLSGAVELPGANIQIWKTNNTVNQKFKLARGKDGLYRISYANNTGLSLDVSGASVAVGANVIVWSSHNGCNQKWAVEALADGKYALVSACSGKALDVYGGNLGANGTNVIIWDKHGAENQQWSFTRKR